MNDSALEENQRSPDDEDFDLCATDYEEQLNKGLSISGDKKDFFAEERIKWLLRRFAEYQFQPTSCLDFGCGTGTSTPYFFDLLKVDSTVGTDPSEASLQVARQDWASRSATFIAPEDVPSSAFDMAFCNGVFHHIDPAQRDEALALIYRALRPGGYFALWENNPWNPITRYAMSRVPFDADAIMLWPSETRQRLRASGLEVVTTDYRFFFPRSLAKLRFLEPALRHCVLGAQYLVLGRKPGG